jgi:hypothetical protein
MINYNEIAVIDDGINVDFYTNIPRMKKSIEIHMDCKITEYENNKIEYSHGTVCAAIICKYAKEAVISSVKVLNESSKTTGAQLIKAIEWCLKNNIGIVNLSLGSTDINEKENIYRVINEAVNAGMIIVAASSNDGKITYPASFSKVVGVKTLRQQPQGEGYIYNYNSVDGVDIFAPSVHKLINYFEEEESSRCNSFAAPYVTAQVYNMIEKSHETYSALDIKHMLFEKALNYGEFKELAHISYNSENKGYLNTAYKDGLLYTDMELCLKNNPKKNINIDIPIILIVGEKEQGITASLKLAELFKSNGYRCGLYSDSYLCDLYGVNYLPFKKLYYKNSIKSDDIKGILSLYEIDLGILFVDLHELDTNYIKAIEETIENDIRIAIGYDSNKVFSHNEDKYNIILHSENDESIKLPCEIKSYEAKAIEEVYKYIIQIYD